MLNSVDFSGRPFHFIGIGGIGMSALAYVLAKRKLPVSGSDISLNNITKRLEEQGARVFWSQDPSNLEAFKPSDAGAPHALVSSSTSVVSTERSPGSNVVATAHLPQVICSTAINTNNLEYRAALDMGCPIFHRSDLLAALMTEYQGIAVAGTHGKTTTSSMIGYLLLKAGLDPTIVVGGEVNTWGGNARVGEGPYLVAEADESDGSLVKLAAHIGIVTNIELDHPDHYSTLDEVVQTFQSFAHKCDTLIGCWDSAPVRQYLQPTLTYSLDPTSGADYTVDEVTHHAGGTTARVWERGTPLGYLSLPLLGQHNLSNALAVVATGRLLNLDFDTIADSLVGFEGARRRFERRGEHHQILFVDDYAHHPSEIQATLAAARLKLQSFSTAQQRVVAVFQPHRYSRTQVFLNEFATSFGDADLVVTTDIYSAGEANPGHLDGKMLADAIAQHHPHSIYQPTLAEVSAFLMAALKPGDLVLFLGAGNLNRIIPELTAYFQTIEQAHLQEVSAPESVPAILNLNPA